jgi:hypothetical protein
VIAIAPSTYTIRKGKTVLSAHLLSTVPGRDGRKELIAFAKRLGMPSRWLHQPRTAWEHFECIGERIERAVNAGAIQIDGQRLQLIIHRKRELLGEVPSRRVARLKRALARKPALHPSQL